jgi:glutamyl-Q tRNA(Asp) synthetase
MEDVDRPRTVAGAANLILRALEACGFAWDGEVLRQSERSSAYARALERLREQGHVFACGCSRREVADSATNPSAGDLPRHLSQRPAPGRVARSLRVRVGSIDRIVDAVQGHQVIAGARMGDFVLGARGRQLLLPCH